MSQRGAPSAYRGYRLQALYILRRILAPTVDQGLVFHPEGLEDLDIWEEDRRLLEVVQVKSYKNLTLSDLSPSEPNSFFQHAVKLLCSLNPPAIKLVNFGSIGPEMRQAWAGYEPQQTQVCKKLLDKGFGESDIRSIVAHVELVELDEAQERASVFALLRESLTGIDPQSAFDLLNFWLYRIAEQRETISRSELVEKINNIGRFLAERHAHHSEWFTSITPLTDQVIPDGQYTGLREEFYAGVSARYEHILADLDFRRENKLAEIAEKFGSSRVVIIRGASGQGKSTLAYRYLHETYPETWRFSIELIENRQHALKIARALAGHASSMQMPMAIYIDVSPRDTEWPELVKRLARYPHFHVLVAIREEDYRRANISGAEFDYETMELGFDETEARLIYERAVASDQGREFLDFDEAWDKFGGSGPLMEFVYLLTQTTTLRERLQEQANRIRGEVRSLKAHPDELRLLRLVSVASAYGARLHVPSLINELDLPDPGYTLSLFEKEYLIRLSPDRQAVYGLHPIRSGILVDLLTSPDTDPRLESAVQALPLMIEDDLETFILHALIDRPAERTQLLGTLSRFTPKTWSGLAGVLRALLWVGVHDYIESNSSALELAHKEFGQGWSFAVDLDLANVASAELTNWWTRLGDLFPPERQAVIEAIRAGQTPKEEALEPGSTWLGQLMAKPAPPVSAADWSGAAELCYWGVHLGIAPHMEQWLADGDLACAVEDLDLPQLADLSLSLYASNEQRQAAWQHAHLSTLQSRLAQQYGIIFLEEQASKLTLHFLPLWPELADEGEQEIVSEESDIYIDPFHDETISRIRTVRGLLPHHEVYASQGYGYNVGSLPSPFDSSINKKGIPLSSLPPTWPIQVNSIAYGLGYNQFRPDTWAEYIDQELEARRLVTYCLGQLQKGLVRYLQRTKAIDVRNHIDMSQWLRCLTSLREPPLLPKSAVDPWGFAHEFSSAQSLQLAGQQVPKAVALQKYRPYLAARQEYTSSLAAFLEQSLHVMITNFHVGKLPVHSPQRKSLVDALREQGVNTDRAHLTTYNLATARDSLPLYQQRFRALFGHTIDTDELTALEESERHLMSIVWPLWYFFANEPGQAWATPLTQIPTRIELAKRGLEKKIQQALNQVSTESAKVTILQTSRGWACEPTLWLRLDLENPLELYSKSEELIAALREMIGPVGLHELPYYIIEKDWKYTAIVPVVRGHKLDQLAWRLHTLATVLNEAKTPEKVWSYFPQPIPPANWEALGLTMWDLEGMKPANQLSEAVANLSILTAQLGDLRNVPDFTESSQTMLQAYIENQMNRVNQYLQATFDVLAQMLDEFNKLSEEEQEERTNVKEAIAGVIQLHRLVRPSEEFDGKQAFTIDQAFEYAQRLEQARPLAEGIRLYWTTDTLDHVSSA